MHFIIIKVKENNLLKNNQRKIENIVHLTLNFIQNM